MRVALPTSVLLAACALVVTACGGDSGFPEPDAPVGAALLPDLVPSPPDHVQMITTARGWKMQFSSVLVNIGAGDFLLRALRDPQSGEWDVEQVVPHAEAGAEVRATPARLVWAGDGHEHWHVQRVAINRLYRLDGSGNPVRGRSWVDSKVGFCFYDFIRHKPTGPVEAEYKSESCGSEGSRRIGMGLSIGWADVYALNIPGQSIDVTDIPDGRYRLVARADEPGWFHESDTRNN
jgi:hypothetical protein